MGLVQNAIEQLRIHSTQHPKKIALPKGAAVTYTHLSEKAVYVRYMERSDTIRVWFSISDITNDTDCNLDSAKKVLCDVVTNWLNLRGKFNYSSEIIGGRFRISIPLNNSTTKTGAVCGPLGFFTEYTNDRAQLIKSLQSALAQQLNTPVKIISGSDNELAAFALTLHYIFKHNILTTQLPSELIITIAALAMNTPPNDFAKNYASNRMRDCLTSVQRPDVPDQGSNIKETDMSAGSPQLSLSRQRG